MDKHAAQAAQQAADIIESLRAMGLEDDAELCADMIEAETPLFEILDALVAAEDEDLILIDGLAARLAELTERKRRIDARKKARRGVIEQALALAEQKKVERPTYTMTLKAQAAKLVIVEESDIPAAFFKSTPKLDRAALTAALKEGDPIPGAQLDNAAPTVQIRRK